MKKFFKIFASLLLCVSILVVPLFVVACGDDDDNKNNGGGGNEQTESIDYVSQLKLDMTTDSKKQKVTVRQHVDGDTTHFDPVNPSAEDKAQFDQTQGYIKARYIAIDTPESTGHIEKWGKKAARFTREKLESAQSIMIESDDNQWNIDSTGSRYVLWVWYLPKGATEYRNLNVEILQEGYARASKTAVNRYGTTAYAALNQAMKEKRIVFSDAIDDEFYDGEAIPMSLRELRCYAEKYIDKKVVVEGNVVAEFNNSVYIEDYDAETDLYFGMAVFYSYNPGGLANILKIGNRVKVVGKVSEYQGSYQITDLKVYNPFNITDDDCKTLETGKTAAYIERDAKDIVSGNIDIKFVKEINDEVKIETVTMKYGEAISSTTVSIENLTVVDAYTTNNGGNNDGAISLKCEAADGTKITVRTTVLSENGQLVTQDRYEGKTISVKGLIEQYEGQYQVKVFLVDQITIQD